MTLSLKTFTDRASLDKYISSNPSRFILLYGELVLDVTDYLDDHPGGKEVLQEHRGKDIKGTFEDIGHSGFAFEQMQSKAFGKLLTVDAAKSAEAEKKEIDEIMRRGKRGKWISEWVPLLGATLAAVGVYLLIAKRRKA